MSVKIWTIAQLPDELVQAWLQHLRDFDQAHPGCHFDVAADAPELSLAEMVEAVRVDPALSFTSVIKRRQT
jgi:hypothetical protein